MKKLLLFLPVIFVLCQAYAQPKRMYYRLKIPNKFWVTEVVGYKDTIRDTLPIGTILHNTDTLIINKKTYFISTTDTLKKDSIIETIVDATKTFQRRLPGKADAFYKDGDSSKIYLDYWLSDEKQFLKNEVLIIGTPFDTTLTTLKSDQSISLYHVKSNHVKKAMEAQKELERIDTLIRIYSSANEMKKRNDQFQFNQKKDKENGIGNDSLNNYPIDYIKEKIKELKTSKKNILKKDYYKVTCYKYFTCKEDYLWYATATKKVKYPFTDTNRNNDTLYFAEKYPPKNETYISLENREYIKLLYTQLEAGLLTVPFKYRLGFEEDGVTVSDEFTANFNVGLYGGVNIGRVKYGYKKSGSGSVKAHGFSTGLFLGTSVLKIDSSTTLTADPPLDGEKSIAVFSPGWAFMYTFRDINIGAFVGIDYGIGQSASKWDYNERVWLGFGFGYNLGMLFKSRE